MKTKEELNALKEEVEAVNKKLAELNEEELKAVTGGLVPVLDSKHIIIPGAIELPVREAPTREPRKTLGSE